MTPSERAHRRRRRRSAQRHGRIGYGIGDVLSLRVPGAARAERIASLLQALTKQKDDTLKKSIFEYTNPEAID
jgi:hypothetical protein